MSKRQRDRHKELRVHKRKIGNMRTSKRLQRELRPLADAINAQCNRIIFRQIPPIFFPAP